MTPDNAGLLPCPFCGGEAEIVREGSRAASMIISCEDCGCTLESNEVVGLINDYHWNTRTPASPSVDAMRLALDALKAVRGIYAYPPQTASETESFGKGGCPLDKADIRAMQRALAALESMQPVSGEPEHPDDIAVNFFADVMKVKLAKKRAEGRSGWNDPKQCSIDHLKQLFYEHFRKGDMVDLANFSMMIWHRENMPPMDEVRDE